MNVDSILISDYANVDSGGKLTVVGVFNRIRAETIPCTHALMAVSVVIHAHADEAGTDHRGRLDLINADRQSIMPQPFEFQFRLPDKRPPPGLPLRFVIARRIIGAHFPEAGPYAFELFIDGTYHASASLYIEKAG